ncbi:hypothetical protein [Gorillibacterium sp. CAU 1737]|uniref:hypothetical protein n=1 Tax=Gorillibacterium sp. CAU 1737 TaxID=3140362 RepID=UPI00326177CC
MATLTRAIILAAKFHDGQKDKGNLPYLFHPLRLMLNALTEEEQIIAVLHDTIEETDLTLEDLRKEGFSDEIVEAIDALSRRKKERYEDFILRIKQNSLARRVKILDLQDNLSPLRTRKRSDKDRDRMKKYSRALDTLLGGFPAPEETEEFEEPSIRQAEAVEAEQNREELKQAAEKSEAEEAANGAPAKAASEKAATEPAGKEENAQEESASTASEPDASAAIPATEAPTKPEKPKRTRGRKPAAAHAESTEGSPAAAETTVAEGDVTASASANRASAQKPAAKRPRGSRRKPSAAAETAAAEAAAASAVPENAANVPAKRTRRSRTTPPDQA